MIKLPKFTVDKKLICYIGVDLKKDFRFEHQDHSHISFIGFSLNHGSF